MAKEAVNVGVILISLFHGKILRDEKKIQENSDAGNFLFFLLFHF